MEVSGHLHAQAALPPEKQSPDRRLGGPQTRYGRCEVEKNLLPRCESNAGNLAGAYIDWAIQARLCIRKLVQEVTLLFYVQGMAGCNLGQGSDYPGWWFSMFSSELFGKHQISTFN
jgi:hypothetical protein